MPAEFAVVISLFLSSLSAVFAVVCYRQASALTSLSTRNREAIRSVESFESRIDELQKRINSLSRKYALEDRRDPETGKSRSLRDEEDDEDPYTRKAALRRRYGLAGMSHVDIARRAMSPRGDDA